MNSLKRTLWLLAVSLPAIAANVPIGGFQPRITATGERLWIYSFASEKIDEAILIRLIEDKIGETNFCPYGWEITKRGIPTKGYLVVEGRCSKAKTD